MARIKPIDPQQGFVLPSGGASPRRATAEDFGGGGMVSTASKMLDEAVDFFDKQEERKAKQWAAKTLAEDTIYWSKYMKDAEATMAPGAEGFIDKVSADVDTRFNELMSRAPVKAQEAFAVDYATRVKARVLGAAVDRQAKGEVVKIKQDYEDNVSTLVNGVLNGDVPLDLALQQIKDRAVPATGLGADASRELLTKGNARAYDAFGTRMFNGAAELALTKPAAARGELAKLQAFLTADATKSGMDPKDYEQAQAKVASLQASIRSQEVALGVENFRAWTDAARIGAADQRTMPPLPAGTPPATAKHLRLGAAAALAVGQAGLRAHTALAGGQLPAFIAENSKPVSTARPEEALIAGTTRQANLEAVGRIMAMPPDARLAAAPPNLYGPYSAAAAKLESMKDPTGRLQPGVSDAALLDAERALVASRFAAYDQMGVPKHAQPAMSKQEATSLVLEWQDMGRQGGYTQEKMIERLGRLAATHRDGAGPALARDLEAAQAPPELIAATQNLHSPGAVHAIMGAYALSKTKDTVPSTTRTALGAELDKELALESRAAVVAGDAQVHDKMRQAAQHVAENLKLGDDSLSDSAAAKQAAGIVFRQGREAVDTAFGPLISAGGLTAYQINSGVRGAIRSLDVAQLSVPESATWARMPDSARQAYYKQATNTFQITGSRDGKGVVLLTSSLDHTPVLNKDGSPVFFSWAQLSDLAIARTYEDSPSGFPVY